jgi:DNA-binding transcriptional regulator YhcF (GntR family)
MAQSAEAAPFRADPHDELPVGVQLEWRLRALIAAGRLGAGERMPSVRTMAAWAQVNVNTVRAVYARLESERLIITSHGRGSYVADGAGGSTEVERIAAEAIEAARAAGVDPRDVAITTFVSAALPALDVELRDEPEPEADLPALATELELDDSWLDADAGAARRELRRQIGRLEAELAAYSRELTPESSQPARPREPRVAGIAELSATRDALLAKLAGARAQAVSRSRRERRAREVRDAMLADPAGHRWEVVSSTDTGEEGCTTWEVSARMGPLGALMNWWRVKVSGGCPLAA